MRVEIFLALSIMAIAVSIVVVKEYGGILISNSEASIAQKHVNFSEKDETVHELMFLRNVTNTTGKKASFAEPRLKTSNISGTSIEFVSRHDSLTNKEWWSTNASKNFLKNNLTEIINTYNLSNQSNDITDDGIKIPRLEYKIPGSELHGDGKTTIIITSSLIPSHPSLWIINETISSVSSQLLGLEADFKLIIGVVKKKKNANRPRFRQYLRALQSAFPHAQLVITRRFIGLSLNVKNCLQQVSTEFVYLLQHDMPFSRNHTINHTALIMAARDSNGYPFCVRFNKSPNWFSRINRGPCFFNKTFITYHQPSGLNFTKTAGWSDK
jgi:hypothetical protein